MAPAYGPHCSHDECSWITCDYSGFVEFCCQVAGCPYCGSRRGTPEEWASDPARYAAMSPADQKRAREYWEKYPMVRRVDDGDSIPDSRVYSAPLGTS